MYIGADIVNADSLVSVAHFKGHELSGFGGTLKTLGMGAASRRGKLAQHSTVSPKVKRKKCVGCGNCTEHCSQYAIILEDKKAVIDQEKCIGCGECILACPNEAVQIKWDQSIPVFMENMMEYAMGVIKGNIPKNSKLKGFPILTKTKIDMGMGKMESETTVTKIVKTSVSDKEFELPKGYKRLENKMDF